jgi:hypothetical protein
MTTPEASLAKALGRAHTALLKDLTKLEAGLSTTSGKSLTKLRAQLEATRKHITEHFRFEEQNGYMDVVRKREPRFERIVEQLAHEHRELTHSLDALIEQVHAARTSGAKIQEDVKEWLKHVRAHETRENELIQDAFNLDIGAED